jgi:hypothetical protein
MMTVVFVEIEAWAARIGAVPTRHLGQLAHGPASTLPRNSDAD